MFCQIKQLFHLDGTHGLTDDEIDAHTLITPQLPKVLYRYYQELGANHVVNHTQDDLLTPSELYFSKNGEYLVFYAENQKACVWSIHKDELSLDNPPVYHSFDGQIWQKEHETLSDFLYLMANVQAVFGLPYVSEAFIAIDDDTKAMIQQHFKKRGTFGCWLGMEIFGNHADDVVVVWQNDGYYDVAYGSAVKAQFDELDKLLAGLDLPL